MTDMAMCNEELEQKIREVVEDLGKAGLIRILDDKNFIVTKEVVSGTLKTMLTLALYGASTLPENFAKITEMTPEEIATVSMGLFFTDAIIQERIKLGFSQEEAMTFKMDYFSTILLISSAIIDIIKKRDPKTYNKLITVAKKLQELAKNPQKRLRQH